MSNIHFKINQRAIPPKDERIRVEFSSGKISGTLAAFTFLDKDTNEYVSFMPSLDVSGYGSNIMKHRKC